MEDTRIKEVTESFSMSGGQGPCSYTQNSNYQRGVVEAAKGLIRYTIASNYNTDTERFCDSCKLFRIADLGCSIGPNTLLAVQNIVDAVAFKCQSENFGSQIPEFQVFFNDHVANDFNTLFESLPPNRRYYAAGVPGSFHYRLFPNASLHFIHCSCALNWLSRVPKHVLNESSPAYNKGRIHYYGAPREVVDAYAAQFARDILSFLHARAKELVVGGLMALLVPAIPDALSPYCTSTCAELDLLGSCLMEMAKMGRFNEEKVDSFNLPIYYTSAEELKEVIGRNENFSIERIELLKTSTKRDILRNPLMLTLHYRAALGGLIGKHFGGEIIDEVFQLYYERVSKSSIFFNTDKPDIVIICVLLKHNPNG